MLGISDQAKEESTHDMEDLTPKNFPPKSKAHTFSFSVLQDLSKPALNNQCHQKLTSQVLTMAFFPIRIS